MTTLYERVAAERIRLREVRQALTASTDNGSRGDDSFIPFYISIADYFEAAMKRLHEQDIRMGDLLREKADMQNPANQQAMLELDERLAGNQQHLARMLAARDALRVQGESAVAEFETAGGAYAAYIVANMGHHPGTADLARALFSADDWALMADVSEADQQREQSLYEKVFACIPAALDLPDQA